MPTRLALCGVLFVVLLRPSSTLPSSYAPIYEDTVYQEQQQAAAPAGRPDFQAEALEQFAQGLDADPFGALPLWVADSHPCGDDSNNFRAWPGVTCDAPTGYVTAIELNGKGLTGTLPTELSLLKTLRTLDLANNSFYGPLPSSYSNLTSLEVVDLSYNQLSGTLPPVYSAWDALQSLELHHNDFSGPLPGSWAGLNLLEVIDLSSNNLSGSLPGSWARMQFLSVLDVHNNSLTGTLPPAWSEQRSLLQIHLGDNSIEGVLPAAWAGGMDSLRGFNVTGNDISGSLPEEWSNMTSLQALSVSHNQLTGPIPATWSGLHNLFRVNVTRNTGICGDVPTGVAGVVDDANTTNLNSRCQWDTDAGYLLGFKAGLSDPLNVLSTWKQDSNPCGAEPWQGIVCQDGWVVAIRVEGGALRGPLTDDLMRITRLQALYLKRNQLQGTLPASWGELAPPSLLSLDLSNNQITGPLPGEWYQMTSLQLLDVSSNNLSGQLPDEWSSLKNLSVLVLGSNAGLNGTLPTSWASLTALQTLHADQSSIGGPLPASWAKLTSVREMGLSSNMLTGSVPQDWPKQLNNLKVLDLSGNQQMCGQLVELPADMTLRKTATGLGVQCKSQRGVSTVTAIIAGVCGGVVGAALLAGAAFFLYKSRQSPIGYLSSRWPSVAAFTHSITRTHSHSTAASPAPGVMPPMAAATPPTTPPTGCQPAVIGTGSFAAAAASAAGQHRLAVGSTAADGTPPLSPRSGPGPIGEEALVGASNLLMDYTPGRAHLFSLISQNRSCPGSPQSPNVQSRTTLDPSAGAYSPASPMPTLITGSPTSVLSFQRFTPSSLPFTMSPGNHNSPGASPLPAAVSPGASSTMASPPPVVSGPELDNGAHEMSPGMRLGHSRSLPGSPGAWGSAIKARDHGAGPSCRAAGMDGLMARVAMMRMAEAAAASAASSEAGSTISRSNSEAGASSGGSSAASPIMSGRATPVAVSGRASPLVPGGAVLLMAPGLVTAGPSAAPAADPIGDRDCGSPVHAAHPISPRATLMGAVSCAADASVPSPRGVAALMMAAGAEPVPPLSMDAAGSMALGAEAGEVLSPELVAEITAATAADNDD